tara:strand:- start:2359 stop:3294 length:936 start_codon:yes stop_codon:yes gene_type:complete
MGFLDNSGDIILDAVLTDTGRMRLARGDGSFKIVKFALGDDEINYELYDKNNASGSAYYDLEILQSPVLEAFTDNAASMKSKLVSIPRNNLLYLPVLKLNEVFDTTATAKHSTENAFLVAVDSDTQTELEVNASGDSVAGVLFGESPGSNGNRIRVDQGLDTTAISPGRNIDPLLLETQYLIEMDNRLGYIVSNQDATRASISFVDDDNIASYYLSRGTDREYVGMIKDTTDSANQTIAGPRGTRLVMKVGASLELNTSDYLFDTIGTTKTISTSKTASQNFKVITSNIRVTGVNTGYRIDIPVKFCKKTT